MAQKSLLTDKPKVVLRRYYQALLEQGIVVEKLILFGSYARKKERWDSDLDVCVVSKDFGNNYWRERINLMRLANKIEGLIEPHPYHPRDFADKWDPLVSEIKKHGVLISPS